MKIIYTKICVLDKNYIKVNAVNAWVDFINRNKPHVTNCFYIAFGLAIVR